MRNSNSCSSGSRNRAAHSATGFNNGIERSIESYEDISVFTECVFCFYRNRKYPKKQEMQMGLFPHWQARDPCFAKCLPTVISCDPKLHPVPIGTELYYKSQITHTQVCIVFCPL